MVVHKIDTVTSQRLSLLATAVTGKGGWVDLPESIIVRAGDAPIAAEDELAEAVLGAVRAGKPSVEITVLRGGQSVVLSFPLEGFRKP